MIDNPYYTPEFHGEYEVGPRKKLGIGKGDVEWVQGGEIEPVVTIDHGGPGRLSLPPFCPDSSV